MSNSGSCAGSSWGAGGGAVGAAGPGAGLHPGQPGWDAQVSAVPARPADRCILPARPAAALPWDFYQKMQSFCHLSRLTFSDLLIHTVKNM